MHPAVANICKRNLLSVVTCLGIGLSPVCATGQSHSYVTSKPIDYEASDRSVGNSETPWQRKRPRRPGAGIFKARIVPHWFANNTRFWYRNDLAGGMREFIVVNAESGKRGPAFDHKRVAKALIAEGVKNDGARRLPFREIDIDLANEALMFRADSTNWKCDLRTYKLSRRARGKPLANKGLPKLSAEILRRSSDGRGAESSVLFINQTKGKVKIFWLDNSAREGPTAVCRRASRVGSTLTPAMSGW